MPRNQQHKPFASEVWKFILCVCVCVQEWDNPKNTQKERKREQEGERKRLEPEEECKLISFECRSPPPNVLKKSILKKEKNIKQFCIVQHTAFYTAHTAQ